MHAFELTYQPPYDWEGTLAFLKGRLIQDVEFITDGFYARTVQIGKQVGVIKVTHAPERGALIVEYSPGLESVLPELRRRVGNLFDVEADPVLINAHLGLHGIFRDSVTGNPGMRVPGAFDGFEMAVRSILGQQITVKAATTLSSRFAFAFGKKIATPFGSTLCRIAPQPEKIATLTEGRIAKLGIISARARSIIAVAEAFSSGALKLEPGMDPESTIAELVKLPGIGPWTAHYLTMRGLNYRDAFPKEDIAVQKALGGVTAKEADLLSQPWRPYRSYAVLHLWNTLASRPNDLARSEEAS